MLLAKEKENKKENNKKLAMQEAFQQLNCNFHSLVNIPAYLAIDSFVQLENIDLVAKIMNKRPFLKRLIQHSNTSEVTYKTRVPLLIMHPSNS